MNDFILKFNSVRNIVKPDKSGFTDFDAPFRQVVIQSTSFCNIDCRYCYLSKEGRNKKGIMPLGILELSIARIFTSKLIEKSRNISFLWHAGEPMVAPISFYQNATNLINQYKPQSIAFNQTITTNGTLINDDWCIFLIKNNIKLRISIDGPDFIHNKYRLTRTGKGTFHLVERGIQLLQKYGVEYSILTTITHESLNHAKELFDFFQGIKVKYVGLNFESILGDNKKSTLDLDVIKSTTKTFISDFFELCKQNKHPFLVREFHKILYLILEEKDINLFPRENSTPFSTLNIDISGNFSTFSPELLDVKNDLYGGDFILGNIKTLSFDDAIESFKLKAIEIDIKKGIDKCQSNCSYFPVCGGGWPVYKLAENGTFDSTETLRCQLQVQQVADVLISNLTNKIQ